MGEGSRPQPEPRCVTVGAPSASHGGGGEILEIWGHDQHSRPLGDPDQAAIGFLWELWRDDQTGAANGYREVWSGPVDPMYDAMPEKGGPD